MFFQIEEELEECCQNDPLSELENVKMQPNAIEEKFLSAEIIASSDAEEASNHQAMDEENVNYKMLECVST